MLISNIDYNASTDLTIAGQCPVASHGLHSIPRGKRTCECCGISACELMENGTYRVDGRKGPLTLASHDGTEAMATYIQLTA